MSNYLVTDTDMTSVADAIRTKGGTSASLAFPTGFVNAINDIPSGGGGVQNVTVEVTTSGHMLSIDDWYLPSYATRSGNTVTVPQYGAFLLWLTDSIDQTSQTGTVERNIMTDRNGDRIVIYAGESGGTITIHGLM